MTTSMIRRFSTTSLLLFALLPWVAVLGIQGCGGGDTPKEEKKEEPAGEATEAPAGGGELDPWKTPCNLPEEAAPGPCECIGPTGWEPADSGMLKDAYTCCKTWSSHNCNVEKNGPKIKGWKDEWCEMTYSGLQILSSITKSEISEHSFQYTITGIFFKILLST